MVRLLLVVLIGAIAIGLLSGGRFSTLAEHRFRLGWLGIVGVVLQFVPARDTVGDLVLVASFLCLFVVCAANRRLPGFVLIFVGLALNFIVIVVNQGMPVSREAVVTSGQADTLNDLAELDSPKHHLQRPDDRLMPLADVIPIGPPIRQVVSAGDLAVLGGVAWFLVAAMRRRPRARQGDHEAARDGDADDPADGAVTARGGPS